MKKLRDYQIKNSNECTDILNKYGLVYLQHTQRTGKTLTALQIAENIKATKVIFITKKKAININFKRF
jgi:superfamily II DNA or RNA helicase